MLLAFLAAATCSAAERIAPLSVITDIPRTCLITLEKSFSRQAALPWTAIVGSTAVLYHNDQNFLEDVQREGRHAGIGNGDNTRAVVEIGPYPLFRAPTDTGSALYFLGDGWTHFTIAGSFYAFGKWGDSARAHNTALQIVHGMVVSTLFSQVLKRGTGRESPSEASEPRGKWRPFPSARAYSSNTPMYDAFPSGHVMTATLTFTIIHSNYPEYAAYTLPIGTLWISALGLQMMNNGVHWASDYPLALGLGYVVAKSSLNLGKKAEESEPKRSAKYLILPTEVSGAPGILALVEFP